MRLDDMQVFAKVVEAGSFTGAGRLLGLPKSTVSRRLAELEAGLGVRLLERTTRRLRLTEVGETYHAACLRVMAEAEAAQQAVMETRRAPHGVLRITAPQVFGEAFLTPVIATFLAQWPAVEVDVVLTDQVLDLVAHRIDLAIRAGQMPDSSFIARKLGSADSICCASPAYLEARGAPRAPTDLEGHDCLMLRLGSQKPRWTFTGPDGDLGARRGALSGQQLPDGASGRARRAWIARMPTFCAPTTSRAAGWCRCRRLQLAGGLAVCGVPVEPAPRPRSGVLDLLFEHFGDARPWMIDPGTAQRG
ncbi:MAG: LysR family transcriptional regulator [Myxococcales bacterium]|nr:LysR family transcriptional regulator [Myxococcales bacterium]